MKVFCIDVGNTSTHFGVLERGKVLGEGRHDTHSLASADELVTFAQSYEIDGVACSSVVPRVTSLLRADFGGVNLPYLPLKPDYCKGLKITSKNPHLIGQDLLANAMGGQKHYGTPIIIVDMGTATTLNIVTKERGFEGGIIAPGFRMLASALHEKTALLPPLTPEYLNSLPEGLGGSTIECMQIGCVLGYQGLLEALLNRVQECLKSLTGEPYQVICTGGNSRFFTKIWDSVDVFDFNLTLKGLEEAFIRQYT